MTQNSHDLSSKSIRDMTHMGWFRLVGSLKLRVSFAKETYQRYYFLQKRPINLNSLLIVALPYVYGMTRSHVCDMTHMCVT